MIVNSHGLAIVIVLHQVGENGSHFLGNQTVLKGMLTLIVGCFIAEAHWA